MKISALFSALATATLLSTIGANGGTLSITSGPIFSPNGVFTNNNIQADVLQSPGDMTGSVVRFTGSSDIAPSSSPAPSISVSGAFSSTAQDIASFAYSFTADLNSPTPITLSLAGSATILVNNIPFLTIPIMGDSITIMPGSNQYSGASQANTPLGAFSGTYNFTVSFNFNPQTIGAPLAAVNQPSGGLNIDIQQLDFQLAKTAAEAIPEPSSFAFLGVGIGALLLVARRRRLSGGVL